MMKNTNHPAKGSRITVDPITELKDIQTIKKLLEGKPRDLCLFTLGINTNLRAGDLLKIKVGQVRHLKVKDHLTLNETKTGKPRRITLNKAVVDSIQGHLEASQLNDTDHLFTGQRGTLTVSTVNHMVKKWCKAINLKGNYGAHTLRKTFGYHQRVTFKVDIPVLMESFNHSTQAQTLRYLCIQPEEQEDMYMNEL